MADLRLLIVADDPLARTGLGLMLANVSGCEIVSQIHSADILEELADAHKLDVIIWDIGWDIPEQLPDWIEQEIPVVALLSPFLLDGETIRRFWGGHIRALLTRESDGTKLAAAAHTAVHHLTVLDNDIAALLLPVHDREHEGDTAVTQPLTPRETEVLHLLAEGLTNKAIARQLHVSEHTIKFHVNAIMGKLNAQSRTDAVVRATRLGLLAL